MARKRSTSKKTIESHELQDFVKEDETKPNKILYSRDPSLDPQLIWKRKDEVRQFYLEEYITGNWST